MNTTLRAALWMTGTIASFSIMAVAGRELAPALDTFEIMLYRSVLGVLLVGGFLSITRRWSDLRGAPIRTHLIRNIAHFTGQNLWFYALTLIPLAQVFALEFTSPIWVILLAPLVLGERLTPMRMIAGLLGFVGILIVARPGIDSLNTGVFTALIAAICFAITTLMTSRLTRSQSTACILFFLTSMQLVMGLIAAGYDGDIALPGPAELPLVILVGLTGLMAHLCLTMALSIAPATVVVPIDFVRLPTIAIIGMILYAEHPDIWVFVGALIIFCGNYLNLWYEARKPRQAM